LRSQRRVNPMFAFGQFYQKIIKLYIEKLNHLTNKKNLLSFKNGLASWMNNHKDDKIEHLIALSERSRCDCHLVSSASAVWKTSRVKAACKMLMKLTPGEDA